MEIVGLVAGTVLTLLIFSYLIGDNILYRWALSLLVGAAVGYAMAMAGRYVWFTWIRDLQFTGATAGNIASGVFLLLGALLILKAFSPTKALGRIAVVGNIPLGYLVGAGAAVAVSGALVGTLIPQVLTTGDVLQLPATDVFGLVEAVIVIVGTIATLIYLAPHPIDVTDEQKRRPLTERIIAPVGGFFMVVTLGVAFAGAITSALTTLVMRIWQIFSGFLGG